MQRQHTEKPARVRRLAQEYYELARTLRLAITTSADWTPDEELVPDYYGPRKLSRHLADPRTPEKVRRELGAALVKLASLTATHVDHPALAMRAVEVIFASIEDKEADTPEARTFRQLIAALDELPEMPGGKGR